MNNEAHASHPARPRRRFLLAALLAMLLFVPAALAEDTPPVEADPDVFAEFAEKQASGEEVRPFARIRFEEGGYTITREEGYDEEPSSNAPIYPGDGLETGEGQRIELQLPDGTLVRLDRRSAIKLYDLANPKLGTDDRTVLGLRWGQLQLDVPNPHEGESFRIDTPAASVYPIERSSIRIDIEPDEVTRITVERGRVEVAGQSGSVLLRTGERTRVRAGQSPLRPWDVILRVRDSFGQWVDNRNDSFSLERPPGREYAALPDEVRPYYGELRRGGDWVHDDEYGWVWNPTVEDDWRPYVHGRWSSGPYGPVWVGVEPWSWVVYRYGRWDWRVGVGWCWIPGGVFSGAHVSWYYGPNYIGWCPLGYYNRPVYLSARYANWGHYYFDHHPWVFIDYDYFWYRPVHIHHYPHGHHHGRIRHNARRVRPRFNDGVVSHRAFATRPDHRGAVVPRAARGRTAAGKPITHGTFDTARRVARNSAAGTRPVARLPRATDAQRAATPRRSFRDLERGVRSAGTRAPTRDTRAGHVGASGRGDARRATAKPSVTAPGRSDAGSRPVIRVERPEQGTQARGTRGRGTPQSGASARSGSERPRQGQAPEAVAPRRGATRRASGANPAPRPEARTNDDGSDRVRRFYDRIGGSRSRGGQKQPSSNAGARSTGSRRDTGTSAGSRSSAGSGRSRSTAGSRQSGSGSSRGSSVGSRSSGSSGSRGSSAGSRSSGGRSGSRGSSVGSRSSGSSGSRGSSAGSRSSGGRSGSRGSSVGSRSSGSSGSRSSVGSRSSGSRSSRGSSVGSRSSGRSSSRSSATSGSSSSRSGSRSSAGSRSSGRGSRSSVGSSSSGGSSRGGGGSSYSGGSRSSGSSSSGGGRSSGSSSSGSSSGGSSRGSAQRR